jgi:AraC family transcriptional regulator of adaptative response / DNA-3-methyladenine glycosylase II
VRHVFGLDIDMTAIGRHLSCDPVLAPLVAARPGLRPTGGWEPFEIAIRAVLGQQITVGSARALGGRLAALATRSGCFPTRAEVLVADLAQLGMPRSRRATLLAVADADPAVFRPCDALDAAIAGLCSIRGVGPWTAHYIALRALRHPDAFPASDVALLRTMARLDGTPRDSKALLARAEMWRPYRAFAAQHLWAADLGAPER